MLLPPRRYRIIFLGLLFVAAARLCAPIVANAAPRKPWTTSRVQGSPSPPRPYRVERVFPKLTFQEPTVLTSCPDSDRMFVAERKGRIYSFSNRNDVAQADLAIDIGKSIPGAKQLYGLTFHPRFAQNRYCYLCYVLDPNLEDGTRLSRFRVSATDPPTISVGSEQIILTWRSGGHNGGCLKFGPDGFLYVSTGDAGPAFPPDPLKSGQDISNVLSSIMRIDVDHPSADQLYSIPADNPFVKQAGARGEVWAYGFRNPWKMSFDNVTGDLWVGDVGWELWEMVYRVEKSGNYGWSLVEGPQAVHRERTRGPTPILKPTAEHAHTESRSITGGFVYRGERLRDLFGEYIYGDYVTGKMWALQFAVGRVQKLREIADTQLPIICFGVDAKQELYVVSYQGQIYRLEKNQATATEAEFPRRLSQTGLFDSVKDHRLAEGVESFKIIAEMWQDGASGDRFVAMPGTAPIGLWEHNNTARGEYKGEWRLPENSVLGKTITLPTGSLPGGSPPGKRVETQILHYRDGLWHPYTYVWNDDQSDAILLEGDGRTIDYVYRDHRPGGAVNEMRQWRIASRNECLLCHTTRSGSVQGFHQAQMDRSVAVGSRSINQLNHLSQLGFFANSSKSTPRKAYAAVHDQAAKIEDRVRSYLHVNCAHCHRRGGGGTASMDIVYKNKLAKTNLLDERPTQGTFGLHGAKVVAPGAPYRSVLLYRMAKTGRGRMPYFGSSTVDQDGLSLLRDWIDTLATPDSIESAIRKEREQQQIEWLTAVKDNADGGRTAAIHALLKSSNGALRLALAMHEHQLEAESIEAVVAVAAKLEDYAKRDLFEPFFPAELRRRRLGDAIDAGKILSLKGDRRRGRKLFETSAGLQCRNCHLALGVGKRVGPDLDALSRLRSKPQLLESILFPSKKIEPKYTPHLVETVDGRVFSGMLLERNEKRIVIQDATGKRIELDRSQVEFSSPQQKSLMPELQLRESTAQEVADLLEYILSL